jgi:hypothetical protein
VKAGQRVVGETLGAGREGRQRVGIVLFGAAIGALVLDGEVVVGSDSGMVRLGPGDGTMIEADGSLSPRKTWGEAKVKRALEMVAID